MKAATCAGGEIDLPATGLDARFETLQRELDDIKRILVLLQHRAVISSLLRTDEERQSWVQRFLGWFSPKSVAG
ncbi:MAG: hypothetical protein HY814_03695 [Candidatus Riflebacteria bacterium]|nr:hypothetical protein [Candidatus Riflebacteria bacterium]